MPQEERAAMRHHLKIVFLYDVDDWAIHNVGRLIGPQLDRYGCEFLMLRSADYHRSPIESNILFFGYSRLFRRGFDYRSHADELICTVHDPCEISNFTDRFNWSEHPLRRLPLGLFDRVSVISRELLQIFRREYRCDSVYYTPTYPFDAERIAEARVPAAPGKMLTFFSATNASRHYALRQIVKRFADVPGYVLDHRDRFSPAQLRSILIRTDRKNVELLARIERYIRSQVAEARFFHSRSAILAREDYLSALVSSDVYICTSYMEGGPLPVMEAVHAGLAVLTTKVGQVADWVVPGTNGYFCTEYADFVMRIDEYLSNPEILALHRANSLRIAEEKSFAATLWYEFVLGISGGPTKRIAHQ